MSDELQKILVLLALAGVMLAMNLKATYTWFAMFTFVSLVGALLGAIWLTIEWVFLT